LPCRNAALQSPIKALGERPPATGLSRTSSPSPVCIGADNAGQAPRRVKPPAVTRLLAASDIEETEPLGTLPQRNYLNQMVAILTTLPPHTLLAALHRIERAAGRVRSAPWGPRTLDLDIVLIEGREISDEALVVPHPELPNRDFWQRQLDQLKRMTTDG